MMLEFEGTIADLFDAIKKQPENEKQCIALRSDPTCVQRGLDQSSLRSIVSGSRLGPDRMRVISDGELLNKSLFRRIENAADEATVTTYALDVKIFNHAMDFGAVLALDAISEFDNFAREFTEKIRNNFNARSTANLYLTTSKKRSFGGHRDNHDFIAVQIDGEKNWNIEDAISQRKSHTEPEPEALSPIVTTPGTFLYVPRGFWHDPVASGASSTHVTCSVSYPHWEDFSDYLKKMVAENEDKSFTDFTHAAYDNVLKGFSSWWQDRIDSENSLSAKW